MYIIIWILWFLVLVLLHEAGHFVIARFFGVKVHEFGIWIPPKIKTLYKDKKWTEYTLNLLPIWGFIRPKWEDLSNDKDIYDPDSFHSKKLWQKILILLWWVFMNLLIAFVFFTLAFWKWIYPISILPDSLTSFTAESYLFPTTSFAQKVWYINEEKQPLKALWVVKDDSGLDKDKILSLQIPIQTGDIINYIWNIKIDNTNAWTELKKYLGKDVKIWVLRNNKQLFFTGHCAEDSCLLWIFYNSNRKVNKLNLNFQQAVKAALHEIKAETILTFEALQHLWKKISNWHVKEATEKLSWPVWAVAVWKHILNIWIWEYIAFLWMISLALAIFNVLPIPALDGGRILTTSIMHIFRLNPKKYLQLENKITIVFFTVLMIFGFYIMGLDILRIINWQI